jgi:uncharacterized repeat protein (TIGR01451 family)
MKRLLMSATALMTLQKIALTLLCCTVLMAYAAPAQTLQQIKNDPGTNEGPPVGAILDLSGTPIPGGGNGTYQQYTVSFVAGLSNTAITFAFREDPAFISFANVSVVDTTTESGNLLFNGDFSKGTYTNNGNGLTPNGWTYANIYGAYAGGIVQSPGSCAPGYPNCWYDGAVQAYDAISQTIATNVGDTYQIAFWVADNSGCRTDGVPPCNFSDLSTNGDTTDTGGNGINVAVYAQAGLPPPPPQGETLTLTEFGQGSGTVTDNLEEIDCSLANGSQTGTCMANYQSGTVVTLTATANSPSTFGGWGGACASFGTSITCNVTMNAAQNVTAIFNVTGPIQVGTVQQGTQLDLNYEGGFANGGYDANAELLSGSPETLQVNAIVQPVGDPPFSCNQLVQTSFPGAQCFVYNDSTGTVTYGTVMFEYTCPGSQTGGTCGSASQANFFATLGTDFYFDQANDPGFYANANLPLVGWLKGSGPDPLHPCTPYPNNSQPLFQSNQISSFTDPLKSPTGGSGKGGSSGTGSCWVLTYLTPGEAPSVNVVAPANGGTYQQGHTTSANYTCTTVNNGNAATGPYLTQASCSAIDSPGGVVAQGGQFDTTTLGLHTFTATVVDSALNTVSQTVTYTVVGSTDVAILKVALPRVRSGSKLTYLIGVGDLGNANAVNVSVKDPLPSGTTFLNASGTNVACSIVKGKLNCTTTPVPCAFAGGTVSCNVGTIMPVSFYDLNGAVIQITVQVTASAGTVLSNTATVSESNADTNPSNNSSTASTTVTSH